MITQLLLVGAGGAVGAVSRLLCSAGFKKLLGTGFPWGTFIINLLGSYLIGAAAGCGLSAGMHLFFVTGVLGGYTTFSTFNYEAVNLLKSRRCLEFFAYAAGSFVLCLTLTAAGYFMWR